MMRRVLTTGAVTALGLTASLLTAGVAAAATQPTKPFHRSGFASFILSPAAELVVIVLCALLIGLCFSSFFVPTNTQLRKRMAEFVSMATPRDTDVLVSTPRGGVLGGTERSLESYGWWTNFKEELAISEVKVPAIEIVAVTIIATALTVVVISIVAGSAVFGVLGLTVPFVVRIYLKGKLTRRRSQFSEQLPDSLQVVASALRGGHSLVGALSVVVDASSEPMRSEMQRVVADEQLGTPLEEALTVVAKRMDNTDIEQLALVARLQRDSGISAAEVIDRVTETVRERFELRRLVATLTSQARLSRWIVTLLPVALGIVISLLNPHYMHPLFSHLLGRVALVVAALMVFGGSLVIKKIVEIKV